MTGRTAILGPRPGVAYDSLTVPVGGLAWAAGLAVLRPGWPEAMLLLACLVVVPLGLGLVAPSDPRGRRAWPWRAATRLQLPAALALSGSFALPPGGPAAALSLPWLAVTVLVAAHGLTRLLDGPRTAAGACLDAGLIYLAVGGAWAVVSRAGLRPLGFPDVIVLMTAVHFHYAGFALPVLAGLAAGALGGPVARAACLGVVAGVPLVAAGITDSQLAYRLLLPPRALELAASSLIAASGVLVGVLQIRMSARAGNPRLPRFLLAVSGLALPVPMALAGLYAWGAFSGVVWLDVAAMFRYHGAVNALGFAVPGLLAWRLTPSFGSPTSPSS